MFHINQDCLPKPCSAQSPQNCPYYQPHLKTHFASIEDAQEEADLIFSGEERLRPLRKGCLPVHKSGRQPFYISFF